VQEVWSASRSDCEFENCETTLEIVHSAKRKYFCAILILRDSSVSDANVLIFVVEVVDGCARGRRSCEQPKFVQELGQLLLED
jgi:hypothetical protein